jgi:hypothetical protein
MGSSEVDVAAPVPDSLALGKLDLHRDALWMIGLVIGGIDPRFIDPQVARG